MNQALKSGLLALLLSAIPFAPAHAMTVLTESELQTLCAAYVKENITEADPCSIYVRGFIDGAIATDPRVTMNVARELERKETFSERAVRTRIGNRLDRYGPSVYAEFCIPQPVPLSEITGHVARLLSGAVASDEPARDTVYRVLRKYYPCDQDTA